jgi:chemotaxis protein MotB
MAKKRRKTDDSSGLDVGAMMNVSLFLIILTFFILLNSIAKIDTRKLILAIGSLSGAFGSFSGGLSPFGKGKRALPLSPPMVERSLGVEEILALMEKELHGLVKMESKEDGGVITIHEKVLFRDNKLELQPSSYLLLNKLSSFIKKGDYPVEIVGHTDNRPAEEKGYRSNWELSTLMAVRVLRYFLEEGKALPEKLTAYGAGSYRPMTSNDTRQSRAQNRRVEIIFDFGTPAYVKRIYRKKPGGFFTYKKFDFRIF